MPDIIAIMPPTLDSTMISAFRACPKKFYNEFILGLRKAETNVHLHAGGAFAAALERYYKVFFTEGRDHDRAKGLAFNSFAAYWGDYTDPIGDSPKTFENTWLAIETYLAKNPPRSDHVQPYFIDGHPTFEFSFAIPLDFPGFPRNPVTGEPYIYSGKFDMLGTYNTRPCVKDDKTGSSAGVKWADQWALRSQFIGYVWACQQEGIRLDTVVIRGVIIQAKSIRILEAIKVFQPHLITKWYNRLKFDLHQLTWCWQSDYFPENLAASCTGFGLCPFADLCTATAENEIALRSSYVVKRWSPLEQEKSSDA